jgi:hypothetical protein
MDPERTLCLISVPRAVLEASAAPGEAPVTEVIGEKKEEGEEGGAEKA